MRRFYWPNKRRRSRKYRGYSCGYNSGYYRKRKAIASGKSTGIGALLILFVLPALFAVINFAASAIEQAADFLAENTWIVYTAIGTAAIGLSIYIIVKLIDAYCNRFVLKHSLSVKKMQEINKQFAFHQVKNMHFENSYDNENFYEDISPQDYLTYKMAHFSKEVRNMLALTEKNRVTLELYNKNVQNIKCIRSRYDAAYYEWLKVKLDKKEQEILEDLTCDPDVDFKISVTLMLTNIQGAYKDEKNAVFVEQKIKSILQNLGKTGDFYNDDAVWQSICRVERGKVSNKMRFAIYERDGHRCRKCGATNNLEIDHIYPIAKGGKSTYDNLQTLCHRCNALKSDTVEIPVQKHNAPKEKGTNEKCPLCGSLLVLRSGRRGQFFGCTKYPECKFTKNI